MARVPIQNQPTVEARPLPGVFQSPQGGDFGQTQARETMGAAANLARASDSFAETALLEARDANDSRVDDLVNQFVSSQQNLLYTDKDAFYRKKGADAINGAQAATDKLLELKKEFVGLASNTYQTKRLEKILGGQINEANNGISRHVADQQTVYEKGVAQGKIANAQNQAVLQYNDTGLVLGMAEVAADAAIQMHKGQSPEFVQAKATEARSSVLKAAVATTLQSGNPRQALALYDKVKGRLDAGDRVALETTMKSTATDVAADDWIDRQAPSAPRQEVRRFFEAKGYSPEAASALAGHFGAESGYNPRAVNPKDGRDGSDSVGIAQWNGPRSKELLQFAKANNLDPYERSTQLEFAHHELQTSEADAGRKLKGAKSLEEANQAVFGYLRPKVQTGRLDLTRAAFNDNGVGFDKANVQGLVQAALSDPGLSPQDRTAVITKLTKESANLEAARTATIKGLDDRWQATTQALILSPGSVPKGALSALAEDYRATGDASKYINAQVVASMEDTLRNFSQAPRDAQDETMRTVAASMLDGKGKAVADSLLALNRKDRTDAGKAVAEDFTALKVAASNGIRLETMSDKAKGVVDAAMKAGDLPKAREVQDWFNAQVTAQAAGQAPPAQLTAAASEMRTKIEKGEQSNANIATLDAMEKTRREQEAAFNKDALQAGASIYSQQLGPLPPATDFPARAAYAERVSQMQGGRTVLPFTEAEVTQMRTRLEASPPEQQAQSLMALSTLPPETIPHVAAALAGKPDTGDQLSRSYAAAMSFYADRTPEARQIADQILQGARITKEMGDAGKKTPTSADAWQSTMQDRVGNIFFDMKGMPAVIQDAVASVYTYQMHRSGRQGEKTDTDVLDKAITTVIGNPATRNGQAFLPPAKGMDAYQIDRAMRTMRDSDLNGLRTTEGDPITADVVIRRGTLSNAGQEGVYFVRIPDPRAGMDLRPVVDADGRAWRLDLRTYVDRARLTPESVAPTDNGPAAARRRAPASPTEGLQP